MRELKFRAWDKKYKKWVKSAGLDQNIIVNAFLDRSGYFQIDEYDGKVAKSLGYDFELMQYTGFKDKNGVEIYDGDILSGKWVVEWESERGFWVVFNPALHYCALGEALYNVPELEVVGNIYENIELWETDKDE
jgi:uncharacterized phage protein (TIGR01671 family)